METTTNTTNTNTTPNRKRKLYAVLPDGQIVTRTTARTYSHVVAVMVTAAEIVAKTEESIATLQNKIASTSWTDFAQREDGMWADAKTMSGICTHKHPHIQWQERIDAERAKIEAGVADLWYDRSWAGRPDLAAKAANDKLIGNRRTMLVEVTDTDPTA
jgi:hypothetical protein